ncbi:MAG: hypothetical protein CMJ44_01130 [Pimelobacter sp.]|nr:hypothetical protein [Pimelobacter sp.]
MLRAVLRLLLALTLATTVIAAAPSPAHAAPPPYDSQYDASCSESYRGGFIVAPEDLCTRHAASFFRKRSTAKHYRDEYGVSPNALYWAEQESLSLADEYFTGCAPSIPDPGPTKFCDPSHLTSNPVSTAWAGDTDVLAWRVGSQLGFIALLCGNFSAVMPPPPHPKITGQKFEDVNDNETKDPGEGWMNGVVMRLYKDGVKLAQTTTSGNGRYTFDLDAEDDLDLGPGTYTIREVEPAGYEQTTDDPVVVVPPGAGDRTFTADLIGNTKETDVQITKTSVVNPTTAGLESEWDLVVRNNGPWPAPDVTLSDTFPSDYTAITHVSHPQCSASGLTLSCSFGTLAVGATRTVTVRSLSRPDLLPEDGPILNTARVDTSMRESDYDNNVSSDDTPLVTRAEVSVTKAADRTTYYGGDSITYTILVTNDGPSWARKVVATDDVPDRFEVLGATSSATTPCLTSPNSQEVSCDLGTMRVGQQHTITIEGRVRGKHPDDAPPTGHEHLLDVQKVDRTWELDGGADGTFDLDCGARGYVTDVLVRVDAVDGGTTDQVTRLGAFPTSRTAGRIVLDNTAAGRAQGNMELVCLAPGTVDGNDHDHEVLAGSVRSAAHTLPAEPADASDPTGVSTHSVVVEAGLGTHVAAPGYEVVAGSARLMESHLREYGWELVFEVPDGDVDAVVTVSYLPLQARLSYADASRTHPRHTHELLLTHPEITVTLPPGRSEHQVTCASTQGKGAKGLTATFTYPPDPSAEPVTWRYSVLNPTSQPIEATFDLVCLELQPGPDSEFHTPENTVVVQTETPDDDPSDNTDSVTVLVIVAAEGDPVAPPTTPTPAGPAPAPIAVRKAVRQGRTILARLVPRRSGRATVVAVRRQVELSSSRVRVRRGEPERFRMRAKQLRRATHLVVSLRGESVRVRLR